MHGDAQIKNFILCLTQVQLLLPSYILCTVINQHLLLPRQGFTLHAPKGQQYSFCLNHLTNTHSDSHSLFIASTFHRYLLTGNLKLSLSLLLSLSLVLSLSLSPSLPSIFPPPPPISKIDPKSIPSQKRKKIESKRSRQVCNKFFALSRFAQFFVRSIECSPLCPNVCVLNFSLYRSSFLFPLKRKYRTKKTRTHESSFTPPLFPIRMVVSTNQAKSVKKFFFSIDGTFVLSHPPTKIDLHLIFQFHNDNGSKAVLLFFPPLFSHFLCTQLRHHTCNLL